MIKTRLLIGLAPLLVFLTACGNDGSGSTDGSGGTSGLGGSPAAGSGGQVPGAGGSGGSGTGSGGRDFASDNPTCQGNFPVTDVANANHSIAVEADGSWGALPHFWDTFGTGHLGLYLREENQNQWGEQWGQLLQEHTRDGVQNLGMKRIRSHGLFHDDLGIYDEVDGQPVFDFAQADRVFDFLVEVGIAPIIELAPMPSKLAADPSRTVFDWGMGISPPKDYTIWQELVRSFVAHSVERYGEGVVSQWDWEVWNEPECCRNKFWAGTLEEYFMLYDHAAAAVRSVLPQGRVGGPVTSQPLELEENSRAGVLFLDHVTTDNYVNPGSPGVLDFFSYHSWSFVGGAVGGYFQGLDLLDRYGLTTVPIAITEFGPTWEFNLYDEPQEMHQGAAFVAQTFSDISRRCAQENKRFPLAYSWWVLSDVFEEEQYREDEPFIGCMGLISREGIKKPAYNAYKFLAQMGAEQLPLQVTGQGGVGGMAARDEAGGIQIILYNGQNPGQGPRDDTYYSETAAHSIGVTLRGLDPMKTYDVTTYRVDETHGNAYAVWEQWGRPTMGAMSAEDWTNLRSVMESAPEPLGAALCGDTFSQTFSLTSPGVLFVTLTPMAG